MRAMSRAIAAFIAAGRALLGVGLLAAPGPVARRWLGAEADRPAVVELLRGIGARDLALGAGALVNLRDGGSAVPWVAAGAVADAADAVAAIAVGDAIPGGGRWGTVALAGVSAAAGVALALTLD
jgi:hypothetical protein